jgi:hypothetical protein
MAFAVGLPRSVKVWLSLWASGEVEQAICNPTRKGKGCDSGYALADNSRERVPSVDACTVTALDAITAFAVPNPG